MHLEFVDLRLFIAVVETGSITAVRNARRCRWLLPVRGFVRWSCRWAPYCWNAGAAASA